MFFLIRRLLGQNKRKLGQWQRIDFCIACDAYLTDHQVMYSNGVCPKCGNANPGTIVETKIRVGREITEPALSWQELCKPVRTWQYRDTL